MDGGGSQELCHAAPNKKYFCRPIADESIAITFKEKNLFQHIGRTEYIKWLVTKELCRLHPKTLCAKIFVLDGKMFSFACLLQRSFSFPGASFSCNGK
jgi:hypothetical protein